MTITALRRGCATLLLITVGTLGIPAGVIALAAQDPAGPASTLPLLAVVSLMSVVALISFSPEIVAKLRGATPGAIIDEARILIMVNPEDLGGDAHFRDLVVRLAVERRRGLDGRYPEDARELDLPIDPHAAPARIRYRALDERRGYRLWTVGPNGIDEDATNDRKTGADDWWLRRAPEAPPQKR